MDFLKKHFEKVAVALALLLLIIVAIWLSYKLSGLDQGGAAIRTKGAPVAPIDVTPYQNAINSLGNPPQWSMAAPDLFGQPPSAPVVLVDTNRPDGGPPVYLLRVMREPFKLLFKAYTGSGGNFQINFRDFRKTFFVSSVGEFVKDRYETVGSENTGYRITKFDKKVVSVYDPSISANVEKDVSEITLQHEGEAPIKLVLRQEAEQQEPVVLIRCASDPQTIENKKARGQRFVCERKTYIVVDITQTQMILLEPESGKKHTIGLTGSR
jgi:hypothetical protein